MYTRRNVHLFKKRIFRKWSQNNIRMNCKKEGTAISYYITGHQQNCLLSFFTLYVMMMRWYDEMKSLFYTFTSWTSRNNISTGLFTNYTLHPRKRVNYACAYQTFSTRLEVRRLMECRVHFCLHIFQNKCLLLSTHLFSPW